jgi:hypothetical protein
MYLYSVSVFKKVGGGNSKISLKLLMQITKIGDGISSVIFTHPTIFSSLMPPSTVRVDVLN